MNKLKPVDKDINTELLECYTGFRKQLYWFGPKNYLLPRVYKDLCEEYFSFKSRPDDIWIVTYPRSGTTLTQELVWMLTHNFDYDTAKKNNLWDRSPFFEFECLWDPEMKQKLLDENIGKNENINAINNMSKSVCKCLNAMPSPRVIKTHLPISMLPNDLKETKVKIIYVARNSKDVALSFFHLLRTWKTSDYVKDFTTFIKQFESGLVLYGSHFEHILEGWEIKDNENVLFLFYENMVKDMKSTIRTLAKFLSVKITEKQVETLAEHVDIKNFKHNPSVNFESLRNVGILNNLNESFIRQGTTRGAGNEFNKETLEHFTKWLEENCRKMNFKFPTV